MSYSLLDQIVDVYARLDRDQVEDLACIPGVKSWLTPLQVPVDALGPALRHVRGLGVRVGIGTYRNMPAIVPAHVVKQVSLRSEMAPWLWGTPDQAPTSGFALTDYQIDAIGFVASRGAGTLWMPAGSGKTIVAWVAAALKPGPILCVTRAGSRHVHERELLRCSSIVPWSATPVGERRVDDVDLPDYLAERKTSGGRPVVILGWEQLPTYLADLKRVRFQTVIWDEVHKGKNRQREKWIVGRTGKPVPRDTKNIVSAAYSLAQAIPRRIATTATAVRNRLQDLWMQLCLVQPESWGRTASKFEARYCDGKVGESGFWQAKGATEIPELVERLRFSVFRVPHAIVAAQLPPKRRMVIRIEPSDLVKPIARSKEEAADRSVSKRERQIADAASAKRQVVYGLIEEHIATGKGKILVFTCRRRDVEHLGEQVERRLKVQVWASHGEDTIKERMVIEDAYMAHPGPCVLVASVQAWGEGLNLQDTDVLICAMLPDTPGQIDQMEGRAARLKQTRPLLVIYPIAPDTYDEHAGANLVNKLAAIEGVASSGSVEGLRNTLRGLDQREQILEGLAGIFNMDADEGDE